MCVYIYTKEGVYPDSAWELLILCRQLPADGQTAKCERQTNGGQTTDGQRTDDGRQGGRTVDGGQTADGQRMDDRQRADGQRTWDGRRKAGGWRTGCARRFSFVCLTLMSEHL